MDLPRFPLILAPTPLHRLSRVSEDLGIELWVKRDDLSGFAMGGNKGRKLEYLIADALDQQAEVVVTCGSLQSNFIRQLAAACAVTHLQCAAATMALPYEDDRPVEPGLLAVNGNVLLDDILGADVRNFPDATWEKLYAHADELAEEYRASGKRVYHIPVGGSSAIGAYAFYQAGIELVGQSRDAFDWILFASSSGSTHTGLQYAYRGTSTRVLGIACDPEPDIVADFGALYDSLESLCGEQRPMKRDDWLVDFNFVGPGYGIPSEEGGAAIQYLARREGIFLDPVYSGKAFAGLRALVQAGEVQGRVLFWHTGGTPALFALPMSAER